MLTKNEITALNLSPTKKDFVQIWNELLEVAGRLSERWDPTSTNESDPGIVILKALTGIADKLNYNIDKNTLEAFMPTAAQEDSMRKLCDMLGYNVKYYRSAETTVTFKYYNAEPSEEESTQLKTGLYIPKFTVLTNSDQDINYFTTNQLPIYISSTTPITESIPCMEGQLVKCESTADNNVITASQISDNNRFYMPEYRIAENGIFVYNVAANQADGERWEKVDNLNIQSRGSRVFKFGYDSYEGRPYLEFPEDWSSIINNGLFIYYTRTSGANGNISARVLTQFELPNTDEWHNVSAESFSIENAFSATTGADIETINQAYNNFKKTVGTFETLVTCRDYMNKIYSMTDDYSGKALVSNALVTDIRSDLNRALVICSCDDAGIFYKETPLTKTVTKQLRLKGSTETVEVDDQEPLINHFDLVLYPYKSYSQIRNNVKDVQEVYDASFKYSHSSFSSIENNLNNSELSTKTIAHNIVSPQEQDIISINNYLKLNAIISTTSKITTEESSLLIEKIKVALANAFNMHELDFGEEIPFDSILDVIKNADTRIGVVSLAEPALYTTFSVLDGFDSSNNPVLKEYAVASDWLSETYADSSNRFEYTDNTYTFDTKEARKIYNKLAIRNVLAGRVPLFKYNTTFQSNFSEAPYRVTISVNASEIPSPIVTTLTPTKESPFTIYDYNGITYTGQLVNDEAVYTKTYVPEKYANNVITKDSINSLYYVGSAESSDDNNITDIIAKCKITAKEPEDGSPQQITDVTLAEGEFVRFRAPNFTTQKTFPAYVNYHLALNKEISTAAKPSEAYTLYSLLNGQTENGFSPNEKRQRVLDFFAARGQKKTFTLVQKVVRKDDIAVDISDITDLKDGGLSLSVDNPTVPDVVETPESLLLKSGFVKLASTKATLKWAPAEGETKPTGTGPSLNIPPLNIGSTQFIISPEVFTQIQQALDDYLTTLNDTEPDTLPSNCDWTISYSFEYVPFEYSTLSAWEIFISTREEYMFGFSPVIEHNTVLWRTYNNGYEPGKYVLSDGSKLLPFSSAYLNSLDENRLTSIYIVKDLGNDVKPNFIENNEEYMLKPGEYLYIEYTPSSITEDGTTQEQDAVREVYESGTIIKPNGFEDGLKDSSVYGSLGNSSHKTIDFTSSSGSKSVVSMYSLGANEQIEIRDLARVVLDKTTLPESSSIYVYKNFNYCSELESTKNVDDNGKRTYTLKDGEYIFYTDQNKAEFAYFSAGTEVTLEGNIIIPEFEAIDLATIFDTGINEIPWRRCYFTGGDRITFQEFQYITIGEGDTLNTLKLPANTISEEYYLDNNWRKCTEVAYTVAGTDTATTLPKISTATNDTDSIGWEACSILELSMSPDKAQTLRRTETDTATVETSVVLGKEHNSGVDNNNSILISTADDIDTDKLVSSQPSITVRSNLSCQSSTSKVNISDLYLNPDKLKSFELKVFTVKEPAIVKTMPGTLIPVSNGTDIVDITNWPIDTSDDKGYLTTKSYNDIWNRVELSKLNSTSNDYENALKLAVCLLPDTYGIFSVYLDYSMSTNSNETWIELLPGASQKDITLLNVPQEEIKRQVSETETVKLFLSPGINCIRVNKTCDLFIKTSSNAGSLLFDDLRLVDCRSIEYVENGQTFTQETQGLNLSQLGYLDVSSADIFNTFDMQIRKKLKEEYTESAVDALDAREQTELANLSAHLEELKPEETKLATLVEFLANAQKEISKLGDIDSDTLSALFLKYKELYEDLARETKLLTALNANSDIDTIEQQLITLLENSKSPEVTKQELFDSLDTLDQAVKANADHFNTSVMSKGDILDDFESAARNDDKQLINDIKLASIKEINSEYTAKLATLESMIAAVANDEARASLLAILENLNIASHEVLVTQVRMLLDSNQASLEASLQEAQNMAAGDATTKEVDYAGLYAILVDLRSKLKTTSIEELLIKVESVIDSDMANTDKYSELTGLVTDLLALIEEIKHPSAGEQSSTDDNYVALVATIDSLLISVQGKIDAGTTNVDSSILNTLASLSTDAYNVHLTQTTELLTQIQGILTELGTGYLSKVDSLKDSENVVVQAILSNLDNYTATKTVKIAAVNTFGTEASFNIREAYLSLPYGVVSVLNIWPAYMKHDFTAGVDKLYKAVRKAINEPKPQASLNIDGVFYKQTSPSDTRKVLVAAANVEAFKQLFEQANAQLPIHTQNSSREEFINQIGLLVSRSPELHAAVDEVLANEDDKLAIIRNILTELASNKDVSEKQALFSNLKNALNDAIDVDTQLLDICVKLLCPSVLLFNKVLPNSTDKFYKRLENYISTQLCDKDAGILALITTNTAFMPKLLQKFNTISNYFNNAYTITSALLTALTDNTINLFNYWDSLTTSTDASSTLLTKEYLDDLSKIKAIFDIQVQINKIKNCKLLDILQNDKLVIAWQDAANKWRDGEGNYYKIYYDNKWVSVADWLVPTDNTTTWVNEKGFWCTASGELVKVDLKRSYVEEASGATSVWIDATGAEVSVDTNDSWLLVDGTSAKILDVELNNVLTTLKHKVQNLGEFTAISKEDKAMYSIWCLEEQLLDEIRALDKNHEFYYNVPIEPHVAINFNAGDDKLNTLMNPAVNYDINNINNNFVISKLDINYITTGLQIARSSQVR